MFEKLSSVLVIDGKDQVLPNVTQPEILENLVALGNEFRQYFFGFAVNVMDDCQDEFLELKNDSRESNHWILAIDVCFLPKNRRKKYLLIVVIHVNVSLCICFYSPDANENQAAK
ncbi:hypothetical protein T07_6984 [Trichinella nelsoni]|uniref:Uncharacterized protein n=1 Tax=Trichinella nelsoni TaxID=6336 RepID=A0A0V0RFW9_9BILA|nr:hypothetical protein T07_6984 [Trichinella nelsoni]